MLEVTNVLREWGQIWKDMFRVSCFFYCHGSHSALLIIELYRAEQRANYCVSTIAHHDERFDRNEEENGFWHIASRRTHALVSPSF